MTIHTHSLTHCCSRWEITVTVAVERTHTRDRSELTSNLCSTQCANIIYCTVATRYQTVHDNDSDARSKRQSNSDTEVTSVVTATGKRSRALASGGACSRCINRHALAQTFADAMQTLLLIAVAMSRPMTTRRLLQLLSQQLCSAV